MVWLVLFLTLWASPVQAQLWSGILDSSRAVDWQNAVYTPPDTTTWTQCGATIAPPSSSSEINAAIAACGANQYVQLGAGTFTPANGISFLGKSNMVLRGMGANQTIIQVSTGVGCSESRAAMCVGAADGGAFYYPDSLTAVSGTTGFTKGSTSLTVSDASGISVGQSVFVTQDIEDTSASYAPFLYCSGVWMNGPCNEAISTTVVVQVVRVMGKSGNTLTIAPGLYYQRWSNSLNPQVRYFTNPQPTFVSGIGVENLQIQKTWAAGTVSYGVLKFIHVYGAWAKGVAINGCDTACIWAKESHKVTVLNSYIYKSANGSSQLSSQYGFGCDHASDIAYYNNITQQVQAPFLLNGTCAGVIFAYNYSIDNPVPDLTSSWAAFWPSHSAGSMYVLMEGNVGMGTVADLSHGTSCCFTYFRNAFNGFEKNQGSTPSQFTVPIVMGGWGTRFSNFVGNVLGTVGYHTNYESSQGPNGRLGSYDHSIYAIGWPSCKECTSQLGGYDMVDLTSSLRWGNYDVVTGGTRFLVSEIPSGNAVPASQTLPPSFYLIAKPSWFGSVTWPPIGPDVAGTMGPGNHVTKIPAQVCAESMGMPVDGTGSLQSFNASSCYGSGGSGGGTPPPAPTGLRVS